MFWKTSLSLTEKKYGETGFDIDGQFSINNGAFKLVDRKLFFFITVSLLLIQVYRGPVSVISF